MAKTYKTLLTKAFTPLKRYIGENGDKHWPAKVLDILETKYHLLPKDLLRTWYVKRRIPAGKLNMCCIYIYDWVTSQEQNIPISNYHDLSKNYKLVLFEGNIFQDGSVYLEKVRPTSSMNQ
jgi:hypothetical protein